MMEQWFHYSKQPINEFIFLGKQSSSNLSTYDILLVARAIFLGDHEVAVVCDHFYLQVKFHNIICFSYFSVLSYFFQLWMME